MQRHHHDREMNAGHPLVHLFLRIISHLTIVLAAILLILFLIDQAKRGEMSFLANQATKWMLLALSLLSIFNAAMHLSALSKLRAASKYLALRRKREGAKRKP